MKIRKDVVAPVSILIGVGLLFIMVFLRDMGIINWNLEKMAVGTLIVGIVWALLVNFVFCKYED